MISVIIVAGGKGKRMGADKNKVFLKLLDKEIIAHTASVFDDMDETDEIIIVTGRDDIEECESVIKKNNIKKVSKIVEGGAERQNSVYNGILASKGDILVIHDAARCLVSACDVKSAIEDCRKFGAAALGVTAKDTLKSVDENGFIKATLDREQTYHIQTPQIFKRELIIKAHENAVNNSVLATDDCALVEAMGEMVKITKGSYDNIKITTPEDLVVGERILKERRGLK